MAESAVHWDDGPNDLRALVAAARDDPRLRGDGYADVYEEWLAAVKVAYTQGG